MPRKHINYLFIKYKKLFSDNYYRLAVLIGVLAVVCSAAVTTLAKNYANRAVGNPVGDLILDNIILEHIPASLVFGFLIWGTLFIVFSIITFLLFYPEYLPASLKSVAFLYFIRSIFIVLTHLKTNPERIIGVTDYKFMADMLYYGNDLFFSGHVALPFLFLLVLWGHKHKWFLIFLVFATVLSATAVLLAKSHYSIDVFAAPFITYSIFSMAKYFFRKDFEYISKPLA